MPLSYDSLEAIYVKQYCNKYFPDVEIDEAGEPCIYPSCELEIFLAKYDTIVASLPEKFSKRAFYKFTLLQRCIEHIDWGEDNIETYANQIELKYHRTISKEQRISFRKEAVWGFLVFLYFFVNGIYADRKMTVTDIIKETNLFITANLDNNLKIKLTAGRKSKEITHPLILKALFAVFHCQEEYYMDMPYDKTFTLFGKSHTLLTSFRESGTPIVEVPSSITERHKSYIIIKTILNEILHCDTSKRYYPQTESIFCLCILHFYDYLLGQTDKVCDRNNIITLTKLMKDFEKTNVQLTKTDLFSLYYQL